MTVINFTFKVTTAIPPKNWRSRYGVNPVYDGATSHGIALSSLRRVGVSPLLARFARKITLARGNLTYPTRNFATLGRL